jgi:arginine decarboxylase
MPTTPSGERIPALSTRAYYNLSQYRTDSWGALKELSESLLQEEEDARIEEAAAELMEALNLLGSVEMYFAYPGKRQIEKLQQRLRKKEYMALANEVADVMRTLVSKSYFYQMSSLQHTMGDEGDEQPEYSQKKLDNQHYFEVLVVDNLGEEEENELRAGFSEIRNSRDDFRYDVVVVRTLQDALIALLFNYNIQSVVIRYSFPFASKNNLQQINQFIRTIFTLHEEDVADSHIGPVLGEVIKKFRPELDLFLVTDTSLNRIRMNVFDNFRRVFYRQEDLQELHLSILKGIQERYETPFFSALRSYSRQPTGVFHAMPVSRGNSIFKSHWIREMGEFYGRNIFLAETSATTGGLDSLLQPTGPLKKAQKLAARAFGAQHTYFVTNGTSTANKIVHQALLAPGDVVLIDRDCHKSHHYAMVLGGVETVYLNSFHIQRYSMYGGVPLEEIKRVLFEYRDKGMLDRVKMVVLTNCTFDGFVYHPQRIMHEVLAIKPDMVFLWDEAWWAFASFTNIFRKRTAMYAAKKLASWYESEEYRAQYESGDKANLPDPDQVRVRVYASQSTHKTLTSMRQGSMIHVYDQDFGRKVEDAFHEAYMTHTSTSPSYQILASLDIGRRQVELEGNELVENAIERAMILRSKIANTPLLRKYFDILTINDLIPSEYRTSGIDRYYSDKNGWTDFEGAWLSDEFALDPTKINLYIGRTGIDGDTFKKDFLMDQFGIQVNKTSRNTVLFMTNIGTTRSSVAYLIGVLMKIARQLEGKENALSREELIIHERRKHDLTEKLPTLPDFSYFHPVFRSSTDTRGGDIRKPYFMANREENCEHLDLNACEQALKEGREVVAASFVTPYPPGFPVLVPGQVIDQNILQFMRELDIKEIHGYRPDLGFKVFRDEVLRSLISYQQQNTLQNV